ncbi:MAG TPA: HAMP domain-containing sensor histidine kinase [Pseudonocardia sp.]|uniref:HAMP domain-containing sensor histidine kinase n=1 Tax=Pseudonocardia sp. TaxID=60912 RepID=UPI002C454F24|nr:HAMP domain-containing sensor histidine kinase [Pseudonocardia sp.]HTF52736.1 HAMP domain-containing sensor histidine kinase [Pseudonocardia sp.]
MIRQLVASYVLLVAVALLGLTVPVAFTLTKQVYGDAENLARREAQTAALLLAADDALSRQALARLSGAYQTQTPAKMDVLSAGRAAINPLPLPAAVDDEAFSAALAGREYLRWERAPALGADGLVIAVPATSANGTVLGAVRISYPSAPLRERLGQIWGFRAVLALAVLIVAAMVGMLFARGLTRPLRQLNDMASRLRDGDLTARAEETGPPEIRTLASTLNTATETIDTLVGSQRAFIGDASHQLRTPLTALRLSLDNIADGVDDPYLREDVEHATAEVVRMSRLVNGLLVLARAEATVTSPEPVRIGDVVADRFNTWRAAAEESGVTLDQDIADQKLCALASPGHLEQVLDNVLSNALEVSPDHGTVTVRTHREATKAVIEVIDQGPGLPAADRHRAFDRFWRGPGLTGRSGSGLGLAIVKQLVSDDGGAVTLDEAETGGLCVRITLRLA